jgi:hypothetical protein
VATETIAGALGEIRKAHATAGGDASSTTPAVVQFPPGTQWVSVEGRNYTTAVVVQVGFCPYLVVLKTGDALATVTDYSEVAQDNNTATVVDLSSLDTAANLDFLYLGSHLPFRGVLVDVNATNSTVSVLSTDYWNGTAWTNATSTDNTTSGGATLAVDGTIVWTVPTDWAKIDLATAVATTGAAVRDRSTPLYWVRFKVSVQLDASTTLSSVVALGRSTNYQELVTGRERQMMVSRGVNGVAGLEHRTDAGTASVLVNVATLGRSGFP